MYNPRKFITNSAIQVVMLLCHLSHDENNEMDWYFSNGQVILAEDLTIKTLQGS